MNKLEIIQEIINTSDSNNKDYLLLKYSDTVIDELFRYSLYQTGIWTQLGYDDKLTHYCVIDQSEEKLLVCYTPVRWKDGETSHIPHVIYFDGYMSTWWTKEDKSK